ncbi:MAG TPA: shikimate dehydrogenase [Candidatus Dormibacteraeota bacterium]
MPEEARRVLLLGEAVRKSLSAALQNAGFEAAGIPCRYEPVEVSREQLQGVVEEIRRDRSTLGANVTIPHKEAVVPLLDELDTSARAIGAVNTISRGTRGLKGWNTDGQGFGAALDELGFDPSGKVAAVIGAGGAARAVVAFLQASADRVYVVNRSLQRAEVLCRELGVERGGAVAVSQLDRVTAEASLVVNATPADLPGSAAMTPPRLYFDLRSGKSNSGRLMLLHQGLAAFQIWTGRVAPAAAMRDALRRAAEGINA